MSREERFILSKPNLGAVSSFESKRNKLYNRLKPEEKRSFS
tara:strand:- start:97 stop:219 length:123 start_codon:yes stop_codon:yes gene_type:complete